MITGVGGLLGESLVRTFAREFDVVGVYRSKMGHVESQISSVVFPSESGLLNKPKAFLIKADLLELNSIRHIAELTLARFGRIDFLVNAAADVHFYGSTLDIAWRLSNIQEQFFTNTFAPMLLAAEFFRQFWRDQPDENRRLGRSVLNVSSISGLSIYPGFGQASYSASKAALNFLSCHMAADYSAFGVRVNAIAPTSFPTLIQTQTVVRAISDVLKGQATGKIFQLDQGGLTIVN